MSITEKLNKLLDERNWTYYKLSKITGISRTTVENLVKGKRKSTSHENLLKFADAFNINISELLEEEFIAVQEKQLGEDYIEVLKSAKEKGIDPQKLRDLIQLIDTMHKPDK